MHVDEPLVAEFVLPDPLQQLLAAQHPSGVFSQLAQQPELGAGQRDRPAMQPSLAGVGQNLQVAEDQRRWRGHGPVPWAHTANQGFLRCLNVLALTAAAIGEADEAARCAQFLRDSDPSAADALTG